MACGARQDAGVRSSPAANKHIPALDLASPTVPWLCCDDFCHNVRHEISTAGVEGMMDGNVSGRVNSLTKEDSIYVPNTIQYVYSLPMLLLHQWQIKVNIHISQTPARTTKWCCSSCRLNWQELPAKCRHVPASPRISITSTPFTKHFMTIVAAQASTPSLASRPFAQDPMIEIALRRFAGMQECCSWCNG